MKKTMVRLLVLTVLCAALLAGCGETAGNGNNTSGTAGSGNNAPGAVASGSDNAPETMLPDVNDGFVDDTDGIITDGDTGRTDDSAADGAINGNSTAGGAPAEGNIVTGTAASARSNGMTIGTRAKAYR